MRVIGIIGYKDSGKTTLIENILKYMDNVAVVKHTVHNIDIENKDTFRFLKNNANLSVITSNNETAIFLNKLNLKEILGYLSVFPNINFVIIEGFKKELTELNIPKIVLLKDDEGDLIDDHTVYVVENNNYNIEDIVNIIKEKAIVPTMNLNCGHCGYNCKGFVKALAKGEVKWDDCVLSSGIKLVVDGKIIPLVPFVSNIVGETVRAMVSTLKGVDNPKKIYLEIDTKKLGKK